MTQILISDLKNTRLDHSFHKKSMIGTAVSGTLDIQKIIAGVADGGCFPGSEPIFPRPIFSSLPDEGI